MGLESCAREMIGAMPIGRAAVSESLGRAAPVFSAIFARSFASLVGSGIPSPRPDVALQLSTPHGGHINRMINTSESIVELDYVLHKYRKVLRPANIGAATMKLEYLRNYEQSNPHAHKVLRVAAELHKYVDTFSDRLSLTQVANVVRGMSSVQYRLPSELLLRLAGGVVANDCAALRFAADSEVRDVFYGFSGQGFTNPLFWSRLCAAVTPRLDSFDPNILPALVKSLELAQQLPLPRGCGTSPGRPATARQQEAAEAESPAPAPPAAGNAAVALVAAELTPQVAVARAALGRLAGALERLQPGRLADAAGQLVTVAPGLDAVELDEQLVARLQAAALRSLPSLNPNQLTSLLLGLLRLRQAAAAVTSPALAAAATVPPPLPPDVLAAAQSHLRAAAPAMQLLHVKRAVQTLAPSAAAVASAAAGPAAAAGKATSAGSETTAPAPAPAGAQSPTPAPALDHLLNVLARRAALLLPSAAELEAGAPRLLTRGTRAHLPLGGKGAGAALRAAAPSGDPRVALDTPLLGLLEGLVRAYSFAMGAGPGPGSGGGGSGGPVTEAGVLEARRARLSDVAALFERVAVVAAAGRARGLLTEEQGASLGARLPLLLYEGAVAPVMAPQRPSGALLSPATGGTGAGLHQP